MNFLRLNDKFIVREVSSGKFALFDWVNNLIFDLNDNQLAVLRFCDGNETLSSLRAKFAGEIEPKFVERFVKELIKNKILSVSSAAHARHVCNPLPAEINKNLAFVQWEIAASCNLRCRHCYNSDFITSSEGLPTKKCLEVVDQLNSVNNFGFQITGGEPLCRTDLFEILEYIESKKMNIRIIFSNALLLNNVIVKRINLLKSNLIFIFSLDGINSKTYDFIRGKGKFKLFKRKIKLIKKIKKRIGINIMLHRKNLGTTEQFLDFIANNFKSARIRFGSFNRNEQGNYKKNKDEIGISVEEELDTYKKILFEFYKRKMNKMYELELSNFFKTDISKSGLLEYSASTHPCNYVKGLTFTIKPDGALQWCPTLHQLKFGNINNISIKEAMLNKKFVSFASLQLKDLKKCNKCKLRTICGGGCRAMVYPNIYNKDKLACFTMQYFSKQVLPLLPEKTKSILETALYANR